MGVLDSLGLVGGGRTCEGDVVAPGLGRKTGFRGKQLHAALLEGQLFWLLICFINGRFQPLFFLGNCFDIQLNPYKECLDLRASPHAAEKFWH